MPGLKELLDEIHDRSLWQVLGIYAAGSWVVLEVVATFVEQGLGPEWAFPGALLLLLAGLPVVLATAFFQKGFGRRRRGGAEASDDEAGGASDPGETAGGRGGRLRAVFTWRNALRSGVAAFALLGLAAAGYMAMRSLGIGPPGTLVARGLLEDRSRILLVTFRNQTPDPFLANVVTEALRVDLAQSPVLRLDEPAFVAQALSRMGRPADEALSPEVALQLATREGIKAVLTGEVGAVGTGYVLSARLLDPGTGEILVSERQTASDSTEILPAIDRLSEGLRERVGESLRSVRADPPLARVATASLPALRAYTQGLEAFERDDYERAIPLLREAVRLDSTFAMAWRKLGVSHFNRDQMQEGIGASTRAYELRDRLSERERYLTAAHYHLNVTGDGEAAAAAYESLLTLDPDHAPALSNLAVLHRRLRHYERAETMARRAVEASDSAVALHWQHLAASQFEQGRPDEAEATLAAALDRLPENIRLHAVAGLMAAARQRWDEADRRFREVAELPSASPAWEALAGQSRAAVAAARGKLAEGQRLRRAATETFREAGIAGEALSVALAQVLIEAVVLSDPDGASGRLGELTARFPLDEIPPADRPYAALAEAAAWAGRPEEAREFLAGFDRSVDALQQGFGGQDLERARATVLLAEGRHEEAIAAFRGSDRGLCLTCPLPGLAAAHAAAGHPDSALAVLERYVSAPNPWRLFEDQAHLGPAYERLARLHEERGAREEAAVYWARLVELWEEADPELQARVSAARLRLEVLGLDRG